LRQALTAALAALLLLAACKTSSPAPTPTATPTPTPAPTDAPSPTASGNDLGPADFDPARAFAHVQALSDDIGPRPAGSASEREAAEYLRDQLAGYGYEAELQPFTFSALTDQGSTLELLSPESKRIAVSPFDPSTDGAVEGEVVEAGIGRPDQFPAAAAGAIALIERGELTFSQKIANAAAAGALGALIYNNEEGLFRGEVDEQPEIPALAIARADGLELASLVASGAVRVSMEVRTSAGPTKSQNVLARPPGGRCRLLAGGHYDSVPVSPGANDNASGTATALEIARVAAADGDLGDLCFALFGSEEVGLIGSTEYVAALSDDEADALLGFLNLDMVGTGTRWLFGGAESLARPLAAEAEARDLDDEVVGFSGETAGSDHVPFLDAGIPAVFLHSFTDNIADDPNYHTERDRSENVRATRLEEIGEVVLAVIESLLAEE
jgi:aminopeptidase YwaD